MSLRLSACAAAGAFPPVRVSDALCCVEGEVLFVSLNLCLVTHLCRCLSLCLCLWLQKNWKSYAHCSTHNLQSMGHSKQAATGSSKRYKPLGRIFLFLFRKILLLLFSLYLLLFSLAFSFFLFLSFSLSLFLSFSLFRSLFKAFLDEAANLSRHKNPSRHPPLKRLSVPSHTVPHPSSRGELITAISVVSQGQPSLYSFRASAFYLYLPIRLT